MSAFTPTVPITVSSVDGSDRRGHLSSDGLLYNLVMNGVDTYDNMRSRYGTFDHGNRVLEGST